ncbi:MAG: hypothetical protein ACRDA0_10460 [Cetobacterium sp.]|uniref:hypothetical protein n=1 Tax=Cetobacterium sp. TaxID=2071632 RepID=UPI003F3752C5
MIRKQKGEWISYGEFKRTIFFSLYKEKSHRKVFDKIIEKFLDDKDFPILKVVYKKWVNRHFYQINNNILITIFEEIEEQNKGQLKSAELIIRPSKDLPYTYDMIKHNTKFCEEA